MEQENIERMWEKELLRHETLHTGNCYCTDDPKCNSKSRLIAFIQELLRKQKEKQPKEAAN